MGILVAQTETGLNLDLGTATDTLAQFVSNLGVGSLCFCCGASLAAPTHGGEGVVLTCPLCNAEVAREEAPALQRAA